MKARSLAVTALTLSGALILGLSGCASTDTETSVTASPTVSQGATPNEPDSTEAATADLGDVVAFEKVTDSLGEYQHVTIAPDAKALVYDASKSDANIASSQYSEADVAEAQKFIVKFIAEESIDSEALDNEAGWDAWQAENISKYLYAPMVGDMLAPSEGYTRSFLISNNADGRTPQMMRDGKPRIEKATFNLQSVSAEHDDQYNIDYLWFTINTTTTYRATSDSARTKLKEDRAELSDEEFNSIFSNLDSVDETPFQATTKWQYAAIKENGQWIIPGYFTDNTAPVYLEAANRELPEK